MQTRRHVTARSFSNVKSTGGRCGPLEQVSSEYSPIGDLGATPFQTFLGCRTQNEPGDKDSCGKAILFSSS